MGTARRVSPQQADGVDVIGPARAQTISSRRTPLGICRECAMVVYSGDTLAMAGTSLLHRECCAVTTPTGGCA